MSAILLSPWTWAAFQLVALVAIVWQRHRARAAILATVAGDRDVRGKLRASLGRLERLEQDVAELIIERNRQRKAADDGK